MQLDQGRAVSIQVPENVAHNSHWQTFCNNSRSSRMESFPPSLPADTGFGNNTVVRNSQSSTQVFGVVRLQPNACIPVAC
jgi:hypothetical protein